MEKYQIPVPLPSQGINYIDDSLISDNEAAEGTVNISFKDGLPQTRRGYIKQTLHEHAGESYGIERLTTHIVNGEERMLFVINNGTTKSLYQFNEDLVNNRRLTGSINSTKPNFLSIQCALTGGYLFGDKTLVADGTKLRFFDTAHDLTAIDAAPYSPTADEIGAYGTNVLATTPAEVNEQRFIVMDDNRIWIGGYGNIVRISHLGMSGAMPDYWPSTQVLKLIEDCTGMVRFLSEMMIFTENTASLISGSTPVYGLDGYYTNVQLPGGYGCSAHDSIAIGDNGVYWANRRGVFRYQYQPSGNSIPECLSEFRMSDGKPRTILKKIEKITDWTKVFGLYFNHEYRLYIGSGEMLIFNSINSTWAFYDHFNSFGCGCVFNDQIYYGGTTSDGATTPKFWIYRLEFPYDPDGTSMNGLSDAGKAITFVLKSKFFDFAKAANKKRFRKMFFTVFSDNSNYAIDVKINTDNVEQVVTGAITSVASQTNLNFPIKIQHKGKKYNAQYELTTNGLNQSWLLKAIVLLMKMKELK